jgi:receptor-type tyrosine-protein phosphatase gamma
MRDKKQKLKKKVSFFSPFAQSHEIHDLEIYTQYLISLQVFNPEGLGPATNVVVMTDEGGKL